MNKNETGQDGSSKQMGISKGKKERELQNEVCMTISRYLKQPIGGKVKCASWESAITQLAFLTNDLSPFPRVVSGSGEKKQNEMPQKDE
ncbi:hypothetical protein NPIL_35321 [Nephila pilipes]|uniref:Uncharacterized protein n=1 Tax=Nephila pilipes TaxID=299642 RepID=A0A8X6UD64_NEPPI|nr:hypothetical protein NPIL_35321 [Nephila pilipes]